jgi:hypothetical protein
MDKIFVTFHIHTTCREDFVFQSLFVFSPGWRVGFTILNWRKTEEKNKKWPNKHNQILVVVVSPLVLWSAKSRPILGGHGL